MLALIIGCLGMATLAAQDQAAPAPALRLLAVDKPIIEILNDTTIVGGARQFVVCDDASVTVLSGLHRLYLTAGCSATVIGGSPWLMAEDQTTIEVRSGTPRLSLSPGSELIQERQVARVDRAEVAHRLRRTVAHSCIYEPIIPPTIPLVVFPPLDSILLPPPLSK